MHFDAKDQLSLPMPRRFGDFGPLTFLCRPCEFQERSQELIFRLLPCFAGGVGFHRGTLFSRPNPSKGGGSKTVQPGRLVLEVIHNSRRQKPAILHVRMALAVLYGRACE